MNHVSGEFVKQIEALSRQIKGLNKAADAGESRSLALATRISALELLVGTLQAEVKRISESAVVS
jgi:hypothetical protein